jgi:hypothetical protein
MRKTLLVLFIMLSVNSWAEAKELTFGDAVDVKDPMKISTLLASPSQYVDKQVTVAGTIVGVCKKRGCWMSLASDAKFEKLRIKVRDGDMGFPMSAKGREALATGVVKEIKHDVEQTRNYKASLAKRLGEKFDVASITSGMSLYQLSPTGVTILD